MDSIQQRKRVGTHAEQDAAGRGAMDKPVRDLEAVDKDDDDDLEELLSDHDADEGDDKDHPTTGASLSAPRWSVWTLAVGLWLALALLWVRWPVYYRTLFTWLEGTLTGGKQEVEPAVVTAAIALPFLASGLVFYLRKEHSSSSPRPVPTSTRRRFRSKGSAPWPLRRLYALRRALFPTVDPVDLLAVTCFLAVQLNLVVGKLLIDRENGKLAKSGVADRLARALGMNALYAMLLSVLLLARRSFAHELLGLSAERATRYHVWSGQFGGLMLVLHGVGYVLVWLRDGKLAKMLVPCLDPETCSTKQQYGTTRNFFGLLALLTWSLLALGSLAYVRRAHFRLFTALHYLALPLIVLSGLHYYPLVFWIAPAVILYVIYRVASLQSRGQASVLSVTSLSDKVLRLELELGGQNARAYGPGQYVYVQVPAIAKREWHPFSISAAPHRKADDDSRCALWLDIRVQRGFTKRLLQLARRNELSSVRVDGYYGSRIAVSPHMVFVAGGSGMAPFLSVLEHIQRAAEHRDSAPAPLPQSVWIIWTSRGAELLDTHCELLDAIRRSPRWKGRVWLHVTTLDGKRGFEDDDDMTEPDDIDSDALTPRVERFRPAMSANRTGTTAFSGRYGELVGLHLFVGALVGCALCMATVYANASVWYVKRPLLMAAAVVGAAMGAAAGALYLQTRSSSGKGRAYRSVNGSDGASDLPIAATELELDVSHPMAPSTPRSYRDASPAASTSALARLFKVEHGRPELKALLASVHSEIQENYGMSARASVWVSGPPDMQREAVSAARTFRAPSFQVHEKAFEL